MTTETLEYRKGNLFDAPAGAALMHSCNCQGSWSSGVALTFKQKFPAAFKAYEKHCLDVRPRWFNERSPLVGSQYSVWSSGSLIVCLFTSDKYGSLVDPPEMVLDATRKALNEFLNSENAKLVTEIHLPKINSDRFRVPWEQTEAILKELAASSGKKWIIWEYAPR